MAPVPPDQEPRGGGPGNYYSYDYDRYHRIIHRQFIISFIILFIVIHRIIVVIRPRGFATLTPGYRALAPTGLLKEEVSIY
jgi:hypothetical protein